MTDDERAALHWLIGGDVERDEKVMGIAPGRAAMIHLLKGSAPLNADLRNALARALEPIAVGEMKFTFELKRRKGRGRPLKDVAAALGAVKTTKFIADGEKDGVKQESLIADAGVSRATTFRRLAKARRGDK